MLVQTGNGSWAVQGEQRGRKRAASQEVLSMQSICALVQHCYTAIGLLCSHSQTVLHTGISLLLHRMPALVDFNMVERS